MATSREGMMKLIKQLIAVWNSHDYSALSEIYADEYRGVDFTDHTVLHGPEAVRKQLERLVKAFPDLNFESAETIFEADRVAWYWCAHGTHQGTLMNIPPTGRQVHVNGVSMLRVENGKFVRGVHLFDMASLLRTIGLLPELDKRNTLDTMSFREALTS